MKEASFIAWEISDLKNPKFPIGMKKGVAVSNEE